MTNTKPVNSSEESSAFEPRKVGYEFVTQYYSVLSKEPHKLHQFYKVSSRFTQGDEGCHDDPDYIGQKVPYFISLFLISYIFFKLNYQFFVF